MFPWNKKQEEPSPEDKIALEKIFSPENAPNNNKKKEIFDGFDPTGLERAAKAARELQELKFAHEAIDIAKTQEKTKQMETQLKVEENVTKQKAFEAEKVRVQEEERRRTIEKDQQARQQNAYYQDQLSRKRHQDQLNAQRQMRDEDIKKQEESQMRIEALRRQTAEYEANIRRQTEQSRVEAESKGRIEQERKNWDLHMQRSKLEQKEFRVTVLEGIREAGSVIGEGVREFLNDREKLLTTVGVVSAVALGIYTAKVSTGVVGKLVEARLSQPPLIRETSRLSATNLVQHPIKTIKNVFKTYSRNTDPETVMRNIILEEDIKQRLSKFVISTKNTLRNKAPFRNMLLYGPPGTGKTLFAKQLSKHVNMNYAIMTGSDILPLGKNAVNEIHKLFDWAEKSTKGLVLFVDEAETFLRKRNEVGGNMSEETRNALNAFLYRTGTASNKFMVIFATNQPNQLDFAINDRTDEMVKFSLPKKEERKQILQLYFEQLIINGHKVSSGIFGGPKEIVVEEKELIDDSFFSNIADMIDGFSGREIMKLVVAWQATARSSVDCVLTQKEILKIVDQRVKQHIQRLEWDADQINT